MRPVNEETLVLLYYGELDAADAEAVRSLLAQDEELAATFAQLVAELDAIAEPEIPERDEFYGRRVWARVDAALEADESRTTRWKLPGWPAMRFAGGALVIAMVAVVAFQMGRMAPPAMPTQIVHVPVEAGMNTGNNTQARLLEASLVRHFDSADRLLTEIANNQNGEVDIESEKEWAKVLLVANRLYRFAAEQAGQVRIAQLLADMEPVLIELANGAGQLTPDEYRMLRQSISDRDLVYKVRSTNIGLKPKQGSL